MGKGACACCKRDDGELQQIPGEPDLGLCWACAETAATIGLVFEDDASVIFLEPDQGED